MVFGSIAEGADVVRRDVWEGVSSEQARDRGRKISRLKDGGPVRKWILINGLAATLLGGLIAATAAAGAAVAAQPRVVIMLEAEAAGPGKGTESGADWEVRDLKGASGGKVLAGTAADHLRGSKPIPVTIPVPGAYRVWVRYHKPTARTGGFYVLFQDEFGEETAFQHCDWFPRLNTETPYVPRRSAVGDRTEIISLILD